VDTPGVHKPRHKLGTLMNQEATRTLEESDAILFVADASQPPNDEDGLLFDLLRRAPRRAPLLLALNKIDLVAPEVLETNRAAFQESLPQRRGATRLGHSGGRSARAAGSHPGAPAEGEPFFPPEPDDPTCTSARLPPT